MKAKRGSYTTAFLDSFAGPSPVADDREVSQLNNKSGWGRRKGFRDRAPMSARCEA